MLEHINAPKGFEILEALSRHSLCVHFVSVCVCVCPLVRVPAHGCKPVNSAPCCSNGDVNLNDAFKQSPAPQPPKAGG